jgi:cysteine-rich repeat protein/predicted outer membrane repeat protein
MIAAAALLAALSSATSAATFIVDSPLDEVDAVPGDGACQTLSGTCTLRAGVQEANALVGADTIEVPAGTYVLTIPEGPVQDGSSGDLNVNEGLTVTGAGAASTIIDGNGATGVFQVNAALTVSGVTIRNGVTGGNGGGVGGTTLVVRDCVVTGNSAVLGGGIYANDLTLVRSTVEGNTADFLGGGVAAVAGSIRESTITGNTSNGVIVPGGDALAVSGGVVFTVANSTIDEITNFSFCLPPPDFSCGSGDAVTLSNVTVGSVRNRSLQGISPGSFTLRNTIAGVCEAFVISGGYNIITDVSLCVISGDTTGNQIGVDPLLGPLTDNGGPTRTRRPGTPALEAGNPATPGSGGGACEATDQRGVARPIRARCDIGAVEADCGDGTAQAGEECDDGNSTNGDGCDNNCRVTGCGNGIVTAGEACDDGNLAAGDCCAPTCQPEAAGSPCAGDGDACTGDVCDGAGACAHTPNTGTGCEDGDPCTTGDQCVSGACVPGSPCSPCLICNAALGCLVPDLDACASAAPRGSRLTLKHGTTDTVSWRWKAADPSVFFAIPSAERFCVYDGDNRVVLDATAASGDCAPESCWSTRRSRFIYRNKSRLPDGLGGVTLKDSNGTSVARARVQGKGAALGFAGGPLATPVRVRLFSLPACYGADFDAGVTLNTTTKFAAKSD